MRPLLRPPLWSRVYICVFLVVWLGLLISFAARGSGAPSVLLVVFAAFGVAIPF